MSESTDRYRKMLETDSKNTEAANGMAKAFAAEDKFELAAAYHRLALAVDPRNTDAMNGMAGMYLNKGYQWYAAIGGYPATGFDAGNWSLMGADHWYRKALAIDPENLAALKGLSEVAAARVDVDRNNWAQEHDLV